MIKEISSIQNTLIKELVQIKEKSRVRTKKSRFLIEGFRELMLSVKGGYSIKTVLFLPEIIELPLLEDLFKGKYSPEFISVSEDVYKKIAYRGTTEGVVALAETKKHLLSDFNMLNSSPLILIGEGIEKPGNIGAILRTADASNIDLVIISNAKSDIYNPNVIRSSVGCVFTTNIVVCSNDEVIKWLKENRVNIYSASLSASKPYTEVDFKESSAIVVGTESTGLTRDWLEASTQNIIIPMEGVIDSMNVSVSAAIILYEAKRQRSV